MMAPLPPAAVVGRFSSVVRRMVRRAKTDPGGAPCWLAGKSVGRWGSHPTLRVDITKEIMNEQALKNKKQTKKNPDRPGNATEVGQKEWKELDTRQCLPKLACGYQEEWEGGLWGTSEGLT